MNTSQMTLRAGDVLIEPPSNFDAGIHFIGRIRTPYATLADCPKNPSKSTCEARVEIDPRYASGLDGLAGFSHVILLYWMDAARRDVIKVRPSHVATPRGVFSLRSPLRPNPIAMSVVPLLGISPGGIDVGPIDCRDGTPLVDIKPYLPSIDAVPDARRP